jgi:molecular chaperone GrpE
MEASKKSSAGGAQDPRNAGPAGGDQGAKVAALEAEVKALKDQVSKLTDLAARAQADLQNAKTRMQKDSDEVRKYATEVVIKRLLPVIDNFQRGFGHLPKELAGNDWVKGITAIEMSLMKELSDMGLKRMESKGQQVDTAKHEVITVGPGKEGEIVEVFEEGYELNGKVIRPAKVKVGGG